MKLISYCDGTWPSIGGVARYDTQLKIIFPDRIFFKGPQEKEKMLEYLKTCEKPIIITDNHLACDIPNEYPILLVHHGCAQTHAEREPGWTPYWRDLCCNGQKKMLFHRKPSNTWVISCSQFCTDEFNRFYPEIYPKFKNELILHASELNESVYKNEFNEKPVILGNWQNRNKGRHLINKLKELLPEFNFVQMKILPEKNETYESFNMRKQKLYLESDIFLQLSMCEGNSYSSLDALITGQVLISTNVGLGWKLDKDIFVELDWEKCYEENIDYEYLCNKIRYAWDNKEELSKNGREWYMKNCRFVDWEKKMKNIVREFYDFIYE